MVTHPIYDEVIQPLGRRFRIMCTNPKCREVFEAGSTEGILPCPNCGKRHYYRNREKRTWVKGLPNESNQVKILG